MARPPHTTLRRPLGFPERTPRGYEKPYDTAVRELAEETGLHVIELLREHPIEEWYTFGKGETLYDKTVTYYLATVAGEIVLQEEEVLESIWVSVEDAINYVTFSEGKKLCVAIEEYCNTL